MVLLSFQLAYSFLKNRRITYQKSLLQQVLFHPNKMLSFFKTLQAYILRFRCRSIPRFGILLFPSFFYISVTKSSKQMKAKDGWTGHSQSSQLVRLSICPPQQLVASPSLLTFQFQFHLVEHKKRRKEEEKKEERDWSESKAFQTCYILLSRET